MELRPGYKRTETGGIPEDWESPVLGDKFSFKNGLNKAKEFFGFGTPIVNYMDVYKHPSLFARDLKGRVHVSKQEFRSFEVKKGDVFFTRTSETVEEIGIAAVMLDDTADTVFSGFVLRARPKDQSIHDQFKKYCFSSSVVRRQITSKSTYTTRALTNGRVLSAVSLPLPPLPEQRAIAAVLSDVDALLAKLDQLIAKKRDLKQAAMQQLLTGQTRLPGFTDEWEVRTLLSLLTQPATYGIVKAGLFQPDGIPMVRGGDIKNGQIASDLPFVTAGKSQEYSRTVVQASDVLIALVGYPGESAKVPSSLARANISRAVGLLRPSRMISPDYLVCYLNSPVGRKNFLTPSAGSAQLVVNLKDLNLLRIPLPGLPEQDAIAGVLSDMDAEIAALEARRDKTRAIKQGMMQELLTGRIRLV